MEERMDEKEKAPWDSFLNFFCLELLGTEVFDYYLAGMSTLKDPGPNDTPLDFSLADHEAKVWRMKAAIDAYQTEKECDLTAARLRLLGEVSAALAHLFWGMCRSHRELYAVSTLGVRKGGPQGIQLCTAAEDRSKPLAGILAKIGRE